MKSHEKPVGSTSPFTPAAAEPKREVIMHGNGLLFLCAGIVVGGLGGCFVFLSRNTRLARRRRKSHSRVVSRSNRPMVRFSVKPPKEK